MKTSRRRFLTTVAMITAATRGVIASDFGDLLRGGLSVAADAATAAGDMPGFKVERYSRGASRRRWRLMVNWLIELSLRNRL